ncbi:MAG: glycosyltransferase [Proteobacteria bacterium]|nr:glycosyltransferase [Pseudomonadota bacterium]
MSKSITTSGFTIVRNAELLDFPFRESVLSVLPLCDEFVINCGDSDDRTLEICQTLQKEYPDTVKIIRRVWTRENQSGGYQLKAQTDSALHACQGKWLIYIQADEVVHEADLSLIRKAMSQADSLEEVDGIVFDYLHFYGNFSYISRGRNWYRREVRAFKKGRGIESYRDAQGFRKQGNRLKAMKSGARVFHYGHVRTQKSLQAKAEQMSQWWGEDAKRTIQSYQIVKTFGLAPFKGSHPQLMTERVKKNPEYVNPQLCKRLWNRRELKNALTVLWEKLVPYRIGEYRNYDLV